MTSPNLAGLIEALKPFADHFYGEPEKSGEPFPIDDVNPVVFGLDSPLDGAITVGHFRAARLAYAAALRAVSDEPGAGRLQDAAEGVAADLAERAGIDLDDHNEFVDDLAKTLIGFRAWKLAAPDPAIPADTQSREGEKP